MLDAVLREDLSGKTLLDMGTGSGIIAIEAAKRGAVVTAVDINPRAVDCVRSRAKEAGVHINAILSDLFQRVEGRYDIIAFNPPYLPSSDDDPAYDVAWSGGHDGRTVVDRFIQGSVEHLSNCGKVFLVQSSLNDPHRTFEMFEAAGMSAEIVGEVRFFYERLYVVEARKCP